MVLGEFLETLEDRDFWRDIQTNLQAGRIRLVFVADKIPTELKRIVEFLNAQMNPAEVLAVEVKQFVGANNLKTMVPQVVGLTLSGDSRRNPDEFQWDHDKFVGDLKARQKGQLVPVVDAILQWAKERGLRVWWGRGKSAGSFYSFLQYRGKQYPLVSVWSNGMAEMQFQHISKKDPYLDELRMKKLIDDFGQIFNTTFVDDAAKRRPSVPMNILTDPVSMQELLRLFDRMIADYKAAADAQNS